METARDLHARPPKAVRELGLAGQRRGREPLAEPPVAGVDLQLLAGLGVLDEDEADVRQLALARVDEPDGEQLVALVEQVEAALPAGLADEVGHDDDERAAPDRPQRPPRAAPARSVAGARASIGWCEQLVDQPQDRESRRTRAGIVRSTRAAVRRSPRSGCRAG